MFDWLRNSPEGIYKKMGFYSDQSGIIRRYNREYKFWEEHLNNTKEQILAYSKAKINSKIAILGSGWLLDVPVLQLSQLFAEVWLFDIRHPASIKDKYKGYNIHFIETDLSGYALSVYNLCKSHRIISQEDIDSLIPQFSFNLNEYDVIISCNILDQLDDLLIEFFHRRTIINSEVEKSFRAKIQEEHIHILPENKTLLITDTKELLVDAADFIISEKELLHISVNNLFGKAEWLWKFDNYRMYHNAGNTWFKVNVYEK